MKLVHTITCGEAIWSVTDNGTRRIHMDDISTEIKHVSSLHILVTTVAATGLYFRESNTLEDLINMNLLPDGCNLRQRSVVHDLLQFWAPSVKLPEIHAHFGQHGFQKAIACISYNSHR